MKYRIMRDIFITTDHPACSYGQPVVLIDGEPHGPMDEYCGLPVWEIVYMWEKQPLLIGEQYEKCEGDALLMAQKFLRTANMILLSGERLQVS